MRSLLTASPMTEAVRVSGRGHRPGLLELLWFAGILEFFGPFFIAVGLFTRPVAFLLRRTDGLCLFDIPLPPMLLARPQLGESCCFIYLLLVATEPGEIALDNLLSGKGKNTENG